MNEKTAEYNVYNAAYLNSLSKYQRTSHFNNSMSRYEFNHLISNIRSIAGVMSIIGKMLIDF